MVTSSHGLHVPESVPALAREVTVVFGYCAVRVIAFHVSANLCYDQRVAAHDFRQNELRKTSHVHL